MAKKIKIVRTSNSSSLEKIANEHLDNGWKMKGGVVPYYNSLIMVFKK
jgi:hypothetical protein